MKANDQGWMEPGARNFDSLTNQPIEPNRYTFKVGLLLIKAIGWIGVALFTIIAIIAFLAHQSGVVWMCAFFILLGAICILVPGHFIFDEESITWRNMFWVHRIYWNEVKDITYSGDGTFALHGENKRLTIAPRYWWSGPYKDRAANLFKRNVEESGLTPYPSMAVSYQFDKNVTASRSGVKPIRSRPASMPKQQLSIKSDTLKVGLPISKIGDWGCVVCFTGSAIGLFLMKQNGPACAFALWTLLVIVHMIWCVNQFIFNEESVSCKSVVATYRIHWSEVKKISIAQDDTFCLYGEDKALFVPPPMKWSGPHKRAAYDLLQKKIKESGLPPMRSNNIFHNNRNVRVSRRSL